MSRDTMRFVECDDPTLTADEALRALRAWVARSWLRSRRVARELVVAEGLTPGAHHVRLDTFVEARLVQDAQRPHTGGAIDQGSPPGPWEVPMAPPAAFQDELRTMTLPRSESVHACSGCGGSGSVTCRTCHGSGQTGCGSCGGSGSTSSTRSTHHTDADGTTHSSTETVSETCGSCSGSGRTACWSCGASGRVRCDVCEGHGRVVRFRQLVVRWSVRSDRRILEHTELPDDLVVDADPLDQAELEAEAIEPLVDLGGASRGGAPARVSPTVNALVNELLALHRPATGVRHLRQRVVVSGVPVYEVPYRVGPLARTMWIYGADRRIHAPEYPLDRGRTALVVLAALVPLVALVLWWTLGRG